MNIQRSGAILLALPLLFGECLLVHEVCIYYCAMLKAYTVQFSRGCGIYLCYINPSRDHIKTHVKT